MGAKYPEHVEHIIPQKTGPKKNGEPNPWELSTRQAEVINRTSVGKLGNFLLLNVDCNYHIKNEIIEFKISCKICKKCKTGLNGEWVSPRDSSVCVRHYKEQIYRFTNDFDSSQEWARELNRLKGASSLGTQVKRASERLDAAQSLVKKRGIWLRSLVVNSGLWQY